MSDNVVQGLGIDHHVKVDVRIDNSFVTAQRTADVLAIRIDDARNSVALEHEAARLFGHAKSFDAGVAEN